MRPALDPAVQELIASGTRLPVTRPAGPTARSFLMCRRVDADGRLLRLFSGPIGCGKTSALFQDNTFFLPMLQPPDPGDGVRRFKHTVVHRNYRRLWSGPIPTFFKVVPVAERDWTGSKDGPAAHILRTKHPTDGGLIEVITEFGAIGDLDAETFARGYETTRVSLMEADQLAPDVLEWMEGRTGRYPKRKGGSFPRFRGVDMDMNAPEFGSWPEPYLDGDHPEWNIFSAPPAVIETGPGAFRPNPEAENLDNLPPGYYATEGKQTWYIRRMLQNKRGIDPKGAPVYEEFDPHRHVAAVELEPDPSLPLGIAFDQGLYPAGVIGQRTGDGRIRFIEEIVAAPGTGPTRFGEIVNATLSHPRYAAWGASERNAVVRRAEQIMAGADPAGFFGGDQQSEAAEDREWVVKLARVTKLRIRPACAHRYNRPSIRQDPLKKLMTRRDGHGEFFQMCPLKCRTLRRGYAAGYQWSTVKEAHGSGVRVVRTIKKNEFSHPCEAGEYLVMMLGGVSDFRDREEPSRSANAVRPTRAITDDHDPRLRQRDRGPRRGA